MFEETINYIRNLYNSDAFIPLHEPCFMGNEKKYLNECVDSTFVSSVGEFVDEFELKLANYLGSKYVVATSNGTAALHIALMLSGVTKNDEVITQPLSFVATSNAIRYCDALPIFIDVDIDTMGLSPSALKTFLKLNTHVKNQKCINNSTGRVIKACLPMHTFGNPCRIDEIKEICKEYHLKLIEDAAESLGSTFKNKYTSTFGDFGIISFNGNKIITAGGGGCIVTNNCELARKAKHITTTAKIPHKWEYDHDAIGYNYRMPNINAALLLAQLENLDNFLVDKNLLANSYREFFRDKDIDFFSPPINTSPNNWLNSIILKNKKQRNFFLQETNANKVMTRPIWTLLNKTIMFSKFQCGDLKNAYWLEDRVVNIPSSVRAQ
jgi:perosamine synthetase